MSAFVVSNETINRLLGGLAEWEEWGDVAEDNKLTRFDLKTVEGRKSLGKAMHAMNVDSVMQRYPDHDPENLPGTWGSNRPGGYDYFFRAGFNLVETFIRLRCLLYQCDEGTVPRRRFYKALDNVSDALAHDIVFSLPEGQDIWDD